MRNLLLHIYAVFLAIVLAPFRSNVAFVLFLIVIAILILKD